MSKKEIKFTFEIKKTNINTITTITQKIDEGMRKSHDLLVSA